MNAQQIIAEAARATTTAFPGLGALGTDKKTVADAVICALRTVEWSREEEAMEVLGTWENCEAFGRLAAMVEYGVVDPAEVIAAIQRWRLA